MTVKFIVLNQLSIEQFKIPEMPVWEGKKYKLVKVNLSNIWKKLNLLNLGIFRTKVLMII